MFVLGACGDGGGAVLKKVLDVYFRGGEGVRYESQVLWSGERESELLSGVGVRLPTRIPAGNDFYHPNYYLHVLLVSIH